MPGRRGGANPNFRPETVSVHDIGLVELSRREKDFGRAGKCA